MRVSVSALPAWAQRIGNADLVNGERVDTFKVWPTAHPQVTLERGKPFSFSLKVWTGEGDSKNLVLKVASGSSTARPSGAPGPQQRDAEIVSFPPEKIFFKIRREGTVAYWLDINIDPLDQPGNYKTKIDMPQDSPLAGLGIELSGTVPGKNLAAFPDSLEITALSIKDIQAGQTSIARVGVRKQSGTFNIKSISSTIPFLSADAQAIFANQNYLLNVKIKAVAALKPGVYDGRIIVETNDVATPKLEIPVKITLTP